MDFCNPVICSKGPIFAAVIPVFSHTVSSQVPKKDRNL